MSLPQPSIEPLPTRFGSGAAVPRMEDAALLAGAGRFTDDTVPQGALHLCFVRSPHPHARIVSIDEAAARAVPDVVAVVTGAQLAAAGVQPLAASASFKRPDGSPGASPPRRALAHEVARFAGEAVAAVVARSRRAAQDGAEALWVDYEPLPAVTDLAAATAPGAPVVWGPAPDNVAAQARHGDAGACAQAFARAAHVVELALDNQRVVALTLEPRSVRAWVAQDGRLTLAMSSQMPSGVRNGLAAALGLPREQLRVTVGDVGGGFGMKTGLYPEDIVVAWCAQALQATVQWTASRSEDFLASAHGRDIASRAALALDAQGRILALRLATQANVGAYATGTGVAIQLLIGPWVQTSVYDIPVVDFDLRAVLTHRAPTGAYRGAGRPEAIYAMERLMDEAARQTGIDRLALRRRNFIRPEQMPYRNPMGQTYDVGRFEEVMDRALAAHPGGWDGFEARAAASRARGLWRGLGIATFLEWTSGNAFEERVTVTITAPTAPGQGDGVIEVFCAVMPMGQGIATSLAQLVVDVFDVPLSQVRVVTGDTDRGDGFGSAGSRSLYIGGSALRTGAEQALDAARALAAGTLEAAPADLEYRAGRFSVRGTDLALDLFELAGRQPQQRIHLESSSTVSGPSWPNGCHLCEVELDPATGQVAVVAYSSVNDVGRVINPLIVRGQLDGGAVQGIGQALLEQMVYEPEGGQPLTGSLMDYAAPRADALACDFVTGLFEGVPSVTNPLGAKGVGELGTIGATPCVVNAVADALARAGRGALAARLQMPLTPSRLWDLIQIGR